jgi:hypothetical protein
MIGGLLGLVFGKYDIMASPKAWGMDGRVWEVGPDGVGDRICIGAVPQLDHSLDSAGNGVTRQYLD